MEMDGNWKKFLDLVGVSPDEMQKRDTRLFISKFVIRRGGIENAVREIELEKKSGSATPGENE